MTIHFIHETSSENRQLNPINFEKKNKELKYIKFSVESLYIILKIILIT